MTCFMSARRADLAGVVPAATAFPKQHQARVFRAFAVGRRDRMPVLAMRAVQLVAGVQRRILAREIVNLHLGDSRANTVTGRAKLG